MGAMIPAEEMDRILKENERLRRENDALRRHFGWDPPRAIHVPESVIQAGGHWIFLDDYEARNLFAMLETVLGVEPGHPLGIFNSGDWFGQLFMRLQRIRTTGQPNCSPQGYKDNADRLIEILLAKQRKLEGESE